jgi:polyisoprenyl-phosphate glycosyltransferase
MKKISIVLPVHNEEANLPLLFARFSNVIGQLANYDTEMILVNDGSIDNSEKIIREAARLDKNIKLINFSRNFGHQEAMSAGIDYSSGDAIITMDSDLQDPPEVCLEMIAEWEKGFEIVSARRRSRKDSFIKKITAHLFYRFLKKITDLNIAMDTGDFRLMDKVVVNALKKCQEKNRFLRGLASFVGFKNSYILYDRGPRLHGKTSYSLKKMLRLAMNGIIGFSNFPLKMIFLLGLIITGLGFFGLAATLIGGLFSQNFSSFYSFLIIASIFLIGGIQIFSQGINGEYIGRIYTEVQNHPLYIVKDALNFKDCENTDLCQK